MRRLLSLALAASVIGLVMSCFGAREARAEWFGMNVDPACVGAGASSYCPTAVEGCNSIAMYYNPNAPLLLEMIPNFGRGGQLAGYTCIVTYYMPQETAGGPTYPECPFGGQPDALAVGGCSNFTPPPLEQLGKEPCPCEDGKADMVGNPINVAIGNKFEEVTDYESQGPDKLVFTRYYNSKSGATSLLGYGWRSNFDRGMVDYYGRPLSGSQDLMLERPDGAVVEWEYWSGRYQPHNADVDGTLTTDGATVWTLTDRDDTVETHDYASGRLLSLRKRSGYQQNLQYDTSGNLASVTDSYGRTLTFTYVNGLLSTMTDPDGRVYSYGYTVGVSATRPDRLSQVTYPGNTTVQYLYEDTRFPYALTGIVDENGNRFASWTYDSARRANSSQHAGGADAVTIDYSKLDPIWGGTVTVTNALGKQSVHNLSPPMSNLGRMKLVGINELASTNTPAASTSANYDGNGYVWRRQDKNGDVTILQNDPRGLPLSKTEANGTAQQRVTTYTWLSTFHLPTQIVEPGRTTNFTYDTQGFLRTKTETDTTTTTVPYSTNGRTRRWTYTYTPAGQLASVKGPRTDVDDTIRYGYDASGTLVTTTNALGQMTQVTSHDASGRPLTVVDPNGVTKTLTYDARGRLATTTVAGATTTIGYDPAGNVISITRPDGSFLTYTYDAAHRLTRVSNAFDERIDYTLDAFGNRTQTQIHSSGGTTLMKTQSAVFDELGRLLQSIGAINQTTKYTYDGDDNIVSITDPLSNTTSQAFDALNRLVQTAAPLSSTINYGYDVHDNRTSVTDPRGLVTSYVYDGLDNLIQQSSPDTGITVYVVDDAGNRIQETDASGHIVQMSYDALNRITAKTFPNDPAENITYRYDEAAAGFGIGRLTSVTDEVGTTSYVYDARGNVVQETLTASDGTTFVTAYSYDLADHVVQVTYPSGRLVTYHRDAMGRTTDVATAANSSAVPVAVVSGATYAPFGLLTGLSYGNSLTLSVQYDHDYQPSTRLVSGAAIVQDLTYGFDPAGNITSITDLITSARSQILQYDALRRLTFANGVYGQLTYGYDAVGNRRSQLGGTTNLAESYAYAANSNALATVTNGSSVRTFTYTAAGNLAHDDHGDGTFLNYSYDQKNRLVQVSSQSAILATYDHDFRGRRMAKDLSGQPNPGAFGALTVHFHYDRANHLIAEENQADATATEYIWLGSMPVGLARNGMLYFVHPDHLGTPQKVTDASQNLVWDSALRPFGQIEQQSFTFTQHLRLPGQYDDGEDRILNNGFRDYGADIGRYVESDPIGLNGGVNTYAYADSNPLLRTDPSGLKPGYVLRLCAQLGICGPSDSGQFCPRDSTQPFPPHLPPTPRAPLPPAPSAPGASSAPDDTPCPTCLNANPESKPTDAPRGTRPIDQSGLGKDDIHSIKDQIGAGPRDWVGVTPDGHIVTTDPETGTAIDHGHVHDYTQ